MNSEFDSGEFIWQLDQIYTDLSLAKSQLNNREGATLSQVEWIYLQDLLEGFKPSQIAKRHHVRPDTARGTLSRSIYPLITHCYHQKTQEEVEISDWHDVPSILAQLGYKKYCGNDSIWEGAPKREILFGREENLAELRQWSVQENCKVVLLTGPDGIGKTALVNHLAHQLETDAGYAVLWISMSTAPDLPTVLEKIQRLLGSQTEMVAPKLKESGGNWLQTMPNTPWLIVLDGIETIMENYKYAPTHQDFKTFFRQFCEVSHAGRLLVTSSQKVTNLCVLEDKGLPVKVCKIRGLRKHATGQLLEHLNVECLHANDCDRVQQVYNGNPQFIRFFAASIREMFGGQLSQFTKLDTILLDEQMRLLLDMQWQNLSLLEQQVARHLSDQPQALTIQTIRESLNTVTSTSVLINCLQRLTECEFVELITGKTRDDVTYQLRPLIRKYLVDYLQLT